VLAEPDGRAATQLEWVPVADKVRPLALSRSRPRPQRGDPDERSCAQVQLAYSKLGTVHLVQIADAQVVREGEVELDTVGGEEWVGATSWAPCSGASCHSRRCILVIRTDGDDARRPTAPSLSRRAPCLAVVRLVPPPPPHLFRLRLLHQLDFHPRPGPLRLVHVGRPHLLRPVAHGRAPAQGPLPGRGPRRRQAQRRRKGAWVRRARQWEGRHGRRVDLRVRPPLPLSALLGRDEAADETLAHAGRLAQTSSRTARRPTRARTSCSPTWLGLRDPRAS